MNVQVQFIAAEITTGGSSKRRSRLVERNNSRNVDVDEFVGWSVSSLLSCAEGGT